MFKYLGGEQHWYFSSLKIETTVYFGYCLKCTTYFFNIYLFWLHWVSAAACRIFVVACGLLVAACRLLVVACRLLVAACMWDLVPRPEIEPRPPALGAWSLSHWTTREVPQVYYILKLGKILILSLMKCL